jgi:hypothetical protein
MLLLLLRLRYIASYKLFLLLGAQLHLHLAAKQAYALEIKVPKELLSI